MKRKLVTVLFTTSVLLLGACAGVLSYTDVEAVQFNPAVATSVEECGTRLNQSSGKPVDAQTPGRIDVLSWNIKKGAMDGLHTDLRSISSGKELVILQEVDKRLGLFDFLDDINHESFSRGFTTRSRTTGVATYSASEPISECHFVNTEPLLRTPKATSITEYSLAGHGQTLLVVNVHAVNISWGLIRYREQMDQIRAIVAMHNGPAILSGDFNTWRQKRMDIVASMVDELDFSSISLEADHRTRFYGQPLDHIFVRGLSVAQSQTRQVSSSDHNPISVQLRL